jgi:O-6-methylguanine DNA methyltransferase
MTTPDRPRDDRSPEDEDLAAVEAALRDLRASAPSAVTSGTLVAAGLADAHTVVPSPIGQVIVAWNGRGITMVDRADDPAGFAARHDQVTGRPLAAEATPPAAWIRALSRRLAGDRRARLPLDLRGHTEFERSVWAKALEIPAGEVRPYGWVAAEIGRARAVRAVGSALGRNPVPLVVPCHRVVRSDGTLGQYSLGGPSVKRRLLAAEGVDLDELERLATKGIRFIGSDTTRIFCLPTCRHARRISPSHRVPFHSVGESEAHGYRACHDCRPRLAA